MRVTRSRSSTNVDPQIIWRFSTLNEVEASSEQRTWNQPTPPAHSDITQARITLRRQSDKTTSVPPAPSNHMPTTFLTFPPRFKRSFFADPVHSPDLSCRPENDAAEVPIQEPLAVRSWLSLARPLMSHALEIFTRQHALTDGRRFNQWDRRWLNRWKDEDATCQDFHLPAKTYTHTPWCTLSVTALAGHHTREHNNSHTMLFARNSLVRKHTGYQYTKRERTAACLHRQLLCHVWKITFKRHGFRLYLGTEHWLPTTTKLSTTNSSSHVVATHTPSNVLRTTYVCVVAEHFKQNDKTAWTFSPCKSHMAQTNNATRKPTPRSPSSGPHFDVTECGTLEYIPGTTPFPKELFSRGGTCGESISLDAVTPASDSVYDGCASLKELHTTTSVALLDNEDNHITPEVLPKLPMPKLLLTNGLFTSGLVLCAGTTQEAVPLCVMPRCAVLASASNK